MYIAQSKNCTLSRGQNVIDIDVRTEAKQLDCRSACGFRLRHESIHATMSCRQPDIVAAGIICLWPECQSHWRMDLADLKRRHRTSRSRTNLYKALRALLELSSAELGAKATVKRRWPHCRECETKRQASCTTLTSP